MARLFISQERLDDWTTSDAASLNDNQLTITQLSRTFDVEPAVRFIKVAGDEDDPNDLVDRVKTEEELVELGADVYMNSVIHGDIAYDVQPGFLGRSTGK